VLRTPIDNTKQHNKEGTGSEERSKITAKGKAEARSQQKGKQKHVCDGGLIISMPMTPIPMIQ